MVIYGLDARGRALFEVPPSSEYASGRPLLNSCVSDEGGDECQCLSCDVQAIRQQRQSGIRPSQDNERIQCGFLSISLDLHFTSKPRNHLKS